MKRMLLAFAALLPYLAADAQIPKPGYVLSDVYQRQCGIADYVNEKFDFSRFAVRRELSEWLTTGDTVEFRKHIYDVAVCDASGPISRLRVQSARQIGEPRDTVRRVYVHNPGLEMTLIASLPADASEAMCARALDSLWNVRELPDDPVDVMPAEQDDFSYAMQYLFARSGISSEPIFTWKTLVAASDRFRLLDRCCDRTATFRIGSGIERFLRRMRFDEDCIYGCESSKEGGRPLFFFFCDGKFWCKVGLCEYVSYDSFESVWRHDKKMPRIVAYRLKACFR